MFKGMLPLRSLAPHLHDIQLEGLYDCGCGDESSTAAIPQITKKAGIITHPPLDHTALRIDPITGEELVHG